MDVKYGKYIVDIKALAPATYFPRHKKRAHDIKVQKRVDALLGKRINELVVKEVFYGPDRGYKNRSIYVIYLGDCGHSGIFTASAFERSKRTVACGKCEKTKHGERVRVEGVLKNRTPTYLSWMSAKKKLPAEYSDFDYFKEVMGEKPSKRSIVEMTDDGPKWIIKTILEDDEANMIAMAVRQAFRHSTLYKKCIEEAKVETENGSRYECAMCGQLTRRNNIQVDHTDPVAPLDGSPVTKENLIDRIWTDQIQVLDKSCHTKKSTIENKTRKAAKAAKASKVK